MKRTGVQPGDGIGASARLVRIYNACHGESVGRNPQKLTELYRAALFAIVLDTMRIRSITKNNPSPPGSRWTSLRTTHHSLKGSAVAPKWPERPRKSRQGGSERACRRYRERENGRVPKRSSGMLSATVRLVEHIVQSRDRNQGSGSQL
jgi:hypothetical protein